MPRKVVSNTRYSTKSCRVLFLLLLSSLVQAELPLSIVGTFQGAKPTERKSEERLLRITITERSTKYLLSGSGRFSTGRSPAPEFSGSGYPAKELPFKFSFEDSFGNKGVAFITPTKTGIVFSATINEVEDPRCLIFYKGTELKRLAQSEPL
jgi:hypothetical protein